MALTVFSISFPVFALAMIGVVWVRFGHAYPIDFVTRMTTTIAVPCLIFVSLMQLDISLGDLVRLSTAALAGYVALALIFAVILRLAGLDLRTYLSPLTFGNTGNLGLPLALFAFGPQGMNLAMVVFAVMAISSFTWGVWHVSGGGSVRRALSEPLVWATSLGGLFLVMGWHTPEVITKTLALIGQMAIPLMLITLGVAVAQLGGARLGLAAGLSVVKIALSAGLGWAIAQLFGLGTQESAVLIVQLATPVAVTAYFLAVKYGADAQEVAGLVVASTLLSVIGLPLLLSLLV